jgi:hypothetical protein
MSYIHELSIAFGLCTCKDHCLRSCTVCQSSTWSTRGCVKELWNWHINSDEGKAAAQRFNDMIANIPQGPLPEVWIQQPDPPVLTDAEIVEKTIDFAEQLGMYMEPWQAAALRAILLHGGDVAIVRGGRGY